MSVRARLATLLVLGLSLLAGGGVWMQFRQAHERLQAQVVAEAHRRAQQLAETVAGEINLLLGGVDLGLQQVRASWLRDGTQHLPTVVGTIVGSLPAGMVKNVLVTDAEGRSLFSHQHSRKAPSIGQRPYFLAHRTGTQDRLRIGTPLQSSFDGNWVFPVSRPIFRDGRFAGTANLSLSTAAIADLVARIRLGDDDIIGLVSADGHILARSIDNHKAMGQYVPESRPYLAPDAAASGVFHEADVLTKEPRIFAWRRLDHGLIAIIGLSEDDIMAQFDNAEQHSRSVSITMIFLLLLFGGTVAFVLNRETRRQAGTQALLERGNAELERRVAERTAALAAENRRNASILDAAMDGFFVTDLDGRIKDCNENYCAMLGYTRGELASLSVPDIEAVENPADVAAHIEKIMTQGSDQFDTRHRRKDGRLIDVEMKVVLAEIGGERLLYAFVHDISARKATEAALILARDAAERANLAKSEFLSRMSHELRTPLNAILGFAQLLEIPDENPLSAQQGESVEEILRAGRHLLAQVNEVLDLARIESGRLELRLAPTMLACFVDDCVAQVQPLARERKISIDVRVDAEAAVMADGTRLKQVLLNLLSNAIKYNEPLGSISVTASREKECWRVVVADSGRGIPPEHMCRLFKPFERLESSYDGIEGTGIGLALTKKLVVAMDGAIGAESTPGAGSRFWFTLPAAAPVKDEEDEKVGAGGTAPPASLSAASGQTTRRHSVLYVEDNPANLKLVRKLLEARGGVRLLDAHNAEHGLDIARRERPDLILLDINLPGMDGFAALRVLQDDPAMRDIPVIAISANAMRHDVEQGLAAGFVAYLTKPLDIQEFTQTLDAHLAADQEAPQ